MAESAWLQYMSSAFDWCNSTCQPFLTSNWHFWQMVQMSAQCLLCKTEKAQISGQMQIICTGWHLWFIQWKDFFQSMVQVFIKYMFWRVAFSWRDWIGNLEVEHARSWSVHIPNGRLLVEGINLQRGKMIQGLAWSVVTPPSAPRQTKSCWHYCWCPQLQKQTPLRHPWQRLWNKVGAEL